MTSDSSGLSAISRMLMAGYRLTSDGCPGCGGPMMQQAPQQGAAGLSSTDASSSPSPSRLVCARCDASQLRGVLNRTSATPRANGGHGGEAGSASDESDGGGDGICDAAFSTGRAASPSRPLRPRPPRPRRRADPLAPPPAAAAAAASDPDLPGTDREPSAAMGDLLLRGWTMLGEACPACGGSTPLMRKRGGAGALNAGETYCVKCRAWVRYQAEGEEEEEREGEGEGEEEEESEEEEEEEEAAAPAAARAPARAAAPPAARRSAPASSSSAAAAAARRPSASAAASVSEAEDSALVDARRALVEALLDATLALRRRRRGGSGGEGAAEGREGGEGGEGGEGRSGITSENSSSDNSCRASAARLVGECARALAAVRAALGA